MTACGVSKYSFWNHHHHQNPSIVIWPKPPHLLHCYVCDKNRSKQKNSLNPKFHPKSIEIQPNNPADTKKMNSTHKFLNSKNSSKKNPTTPVKSHEMNPQPWPSQCECRIRHAGPLMRQVVFPWCGAKLQDSCLGQIEVEVLCFFCCEKIWPYTCYISLY